MGRQRDEKFRQEVYECIVDFWKKNGVSPSQRDIIANTRLTSTSVVTYIVDELVENGLLLKVGGNMTRRTIVVVGSRWLSPEEVLEYNRVLSKQDNRSEPHDRERRLHNPEAPQKIING